MRESLLIILSLILLASCSEENKKHSNPTTNLPLNQDIETQQMVEELKQMGSSGSVLEMWHQNEEKAKYYEEKSKQTSAVGERLTLLFKAGVEWLNAGDYNRSINIFSSIIKMQESGEINMNAASTKQFYELLAVSYLRKGEIENCVKHHVSSSCIIPLDKKAVHKNAEGSSEAIDIYEKLLSQYPDDLQNRWLYNLAQMTLGVYPERVIDRFLISPSVFNSEVEGPQFVDIAPSVGVAVNDISGSCIVDDFNNDGFLDIIASSYGLKDQVHYFQNDGKGKFTDLTSQSGLTGIVSGLNMIQADYDNDGNLDFLILRGAWLGKSGNHPNSLIKNNGDGTFRDVTRSSGIYSLNPTQTASWGDFNNDGFLDLFIGNESSNSQTVRCELFVNMGNGTFEEKSHQFGLNITAFVKGSVWGDIDNDGDLDLYVSNLVGKNMLFENTGHDNNFQFLDITDQAGVGYPQFSFPCWFWDVNNDGYLDIYVNSFDVRDFETASANVAADYLNLDPVTEYSKLYINNGDKTFTERSELFNLKTVLYTMGCNYSDVDNDGFLDFYAATGTPDFRAVFPNRFFKNIQGKSFGDMTSSTGTGHIQKGHGVGFGDIDNDGDEDMYAVLGGSYTGDNFMNALFENRLKSNNKWISLQLEGITTNKSAIGSRVEILVLNEDNSRSAIHRVISSGASFGCNSLRLECGLGNAESIERISIKWAGNPNPQVIEKLELKKFYRILEGQEPTVI